MKEPGTTPWGIRISNADLTKLKAGFQARDQDTKWHIWVSDQSESGNISITFTRAMLGRDTFILHVKPGDSSDGGHSIEAFTWEQNCGGIHLPQELAKKQAIVLCRLVLKCDIEALPEYDISVFFPDKEEK
ncbi:hypothetical protein GQ44DRAFT_762573 [Phaeosphaeriaceae sp. PMI808]|nr:hypothetical protein GQ44DRAFT_762573 [Phaeosphaeriaceae sp. PMI808]